MTILAVHPGALGDLVLFGQLLRALADGRGGRVRLVAGPAKADLLAGLGVVDEATDFDGLPMEEVFADRPTGECKLPALTGPCDLLVSCFAAGDPPAERRLTELTSAAEGLFLPVRPPADCAGHLLDLWADRAGLPDVPRPRWPVPAAWGREAGVALAAVGVDPARPYVVVHPGAGSRDKCWPLERFVELARRCRRSPVFVLGPAEQDWWAGGVRAELAAEFPLLASPPLRVLAGVAAGARAYLGNDSGPTHLAAATAAPTVVLFGPTDPRRFAPRGPAVTVLARRPPAELSVDDVLEAVENV